MGVAALKLRWYGEDALNNDGALRRMIYGYVSQGSRVLDAGAGAGEKFSYDLKSRVAEVVGADLDERVARNPHLTRGVVADLAALPFEDGYFDVVFCRYVLEHVADPRRFLGEMRRVLKPGGCFVFLTPNKWHYVALASRLTPAWFHRMYNRLRGRQEADTFPTLYRLNSGRAIRRAMQAAGFVERELIFVECCPNYLTIWLPLFLLGVAYERLVNSTRWLAGLRVNILGCFVRRAS